MGLLHDSQGRGIDENNPLNTRITTNAIIPVDVQARLSQTIQTHNAVSVAASGTSNQTNYMDCDGFDKLGVTALNDAATSNTVNVIWSNDGVNPHGQETVCSAQATSLRSGITDVKARYVKVQLINGDGALAHIMSAWAYLKS